MVASKWRIHKLNLPSLHHNKTRKIWRYCSPRSFSLSEASPQRKVSDFSPKSVNSTFFHSRHIDRGILNSSTTYFPSFGKRKRQQIGQLARELHLLAAIDRWSPCSVFLAHRALPWIHSGVWYSSWLSGFLFW